MLKHIVPAILLALLPGMCWAQATPEQVLPAKSQLYYRWDGTHGHRAEFDKTATGKMLQGDTGKFLAEVVRYAGGQIESAIAQHKPEFSDPYKDIAKALQGICHNGLVVGIETNRFNPPEVRALFVFPKAAGETGSLLPLLQKAAEAGKAQVKSEKVGKRFLHHITFDKVPGLHIGWWNEGEDAVVLIGTDDPARYAKSIDAKETGIAKHPLYQQVSGFKEFTTNSRGFLDVGGLLSAVEELSPEAAKLVDELGVKGLKSVTFASGYDGLALRSITDFDMPGPRKGLLAMGSSKKFGLKDLPSLPSDVSSFSAASIDVGHTFDALAHGIDSGLKIFLPDQAENIRETIKAFEGVIGIDFRKDLIGSFGDLSVSYSSASEGPLGLGTASLSKVKDGKKLVTTLETLAKSAPQMPGLEIQLKKTKYRDADMFELYLKSQNTALIGVFAVHKDWFVFSQYPGAVKGFILRAKGELPSWKADDDVTKALAHYPKEFNAVAVSDPRPAVQFILAWTPFVVNIGNTLASQFLPDVPTFDLTLVPHPQEATRHLFPGVSVTTDDGKKVRTDSRSSLGIP